MRSTAIAILVAGLLARVFTDNEFCDNNDTFKHPAAGTCKGYWECNKGNLTFERCWTLYSFDSVKLECVWDPMSSSTVPCQNATSPRADINWCSAGKTYRAPISDRCNSYYDCQNGVGNIKNCWWPMEFNPKERVCSINIWPNRFSCFVETITATTTTAAPTTSATTTAAPTTSATTTAASTTSATTTAATTTTEKTIPTTTSTIKPSTSSPNGSSSLEGTRCSKDHYNTSYPGDCQKYYNCWNETLDCPYSHKFDLLTGKCIPMTRCDLIPCNVKGPLCFAGYDYVTTVPDSCDKYSECKNGTWTLKSCPWMYKFDPKTLECKFNLFVEVDCESKVKCDDELLLHAFKDIRIQRETSFRTETIVEIDPQPACISGQNFKTIFRDDCHKYFDCSNGSLTVKKCPSLNKFNPATLTCSLDLPFFKVNCSAVIGSAIQKPIVYPPDIKSNCKRGVTFNRVIKNDCKAYYSCRNGKLSYETCLPLQLFNPNTLKCSLNMPFHRVNCTALTVYPQDVRSKCIRGVTFNEVIRNDCKAYYACRNGTLSYETCLPLQLFNPVTLKCSLNLPFRRVNCTALPGQPMCPQRGVIRKAYPGNCDKYYECRNGELSVIECGIMQQFDHKTLQCQYNIPFFKIDCNYNTS